MRQDFWFNKTYRATSTDFFFSSQCLADHPGSPVSVLFWLNENKLVLPEMGDCVAARVVLGYFVFSAFPIAAFV